jgi:hypothetical protein
MNTSPTLKFFLSRLDRLISRCRMSSHRRGPAVGTCWVLVDECESAQVLGADRRHKLLSALRSFETIEWE